MPFFCQKELRISANDRNQAAPFICSSRTEIRPVLLWRTSSSTPSSPCCSSSGAFSQHGPVWGEHMLAPGVGGLLNFHR